MTGLEQASKTSNMKNNRHKRDAMKPPSAAKPLARRLKVPVKRATTPIRRHVQHHAISEGKKLVVSSKMETVTHIRLVDPDHNQIQPAQKFRGLGPLSLPKDTQQFDPILLPKDLRARKILREGGWFTQLEIERWQKMKNKRTPWTSPTLATKFNIQRAREHANRAFTEYQSMSLNAENTASSP